MRRTGDEEKTKKRRRKGDIHLFCEEKRRKGTFFYSEVLWRWENMNVPFSSLAGCFLGQGKNKFEDLEDFIKGGIMGFVASAGGDVLCKAKQTGGALAR